MSGRNLKDWLTGYVEFTENTESPTSYFIWTGIGCIASALRRFTFFKRGHETIYPNNYIILVGPSGRARKGLPIAIAQSFLEAVNLKVLGQDNTKEQVIAEVAETTQNFTCNEDNEPKSSTAFTAIAEELVVFAGERNTSYLALLTNWYDSRDTWSRKTKHQGQNFLHGVCPTLIASTAPDWIPFILSPEAAGGGFTSRCILVQEKKKRQTIPDPEAYPINEELRSDLIQDLEKIMLLNGRFVLSKRAKSFYDDWYYQYDTRLQHGDLIVPDQHFMTYMSRRATHAIKTAMCLSASEDDSLIIEETHIKKAVNLLERIEDKLPGLFDCLGKNKVSGEIRRVEDYIKEKKRATKTELLQIFGSDLDRGDLENVVSMLALQQRIRALRDDKETYYEAIG